MSFRVQWQKDFVQMELKRVPGSSCKNALCLLLCLVAVAAKESRIPFETCGHPVFVPSGVSAQYEQCKKGSQLLIGICVPRQMKSKGGKLFLKISAQTRTLFRSTDIAIEHDETDLRGVTKSHVTRSSVLIEHTLELPIALPAGKYRIDVSAMDTSGKSLLCLTFEIQVSSSISSHIYM